jgi:hypothetical protein
MANIDEELRLASEAKVAIERRPKEILKILRKAALVARATTFSSEATLNKARRKVGSALESLIPALEANRETPIRMNKATIAIDEWIRELKAARP